jgi:TolB protein
VAALVVVASLFTLSVAGASWSAPGDVSLVSPAPAKGGVPQSAISADGRLVAFTCDVGQGYWQVLVRDMVTGETTLVSRASGPTGAEGNDGSADPSISADGRFVAFDSEASNLSPGDHDDDKDVFVRDLRAQTTTLISRASGTNGAKGNYPDVGADSASPSISADGRFVAFDSDASYSSRDDRRGTPDVFVRDLRAHITTFVSRAGGSGHKVRDGRRRVLLPPRPADAVPETA